MDTDKLIATYVRIRDARSELKATYKKEDDVLKSKLETLESALSSMFDDNGVTNVKTQSGTAYRTVKTRYWAPDWDEFRKFVVEHDALGLFENRVAQGNMKEYLEHYPDLAPPIRADSRYSITVRRGN